MDVLQLLEEKGAEVRYHDPHVPDFDLDGRRYESRGLSDAELERADLVVITTDHREIDYRQVVEHAPIVIDTRNALEGMEVSDGAGATVYPLSGPPRNAGDGIREPEEAPPEPSFA